MRKKRNEEEFQINVDAKISLSPGKAIGMRMKSLAKFIGDDVEVEFEPWPIIGLLIDIEHTMVLGSDDGKEYKLLFGLYIDGKQVDLLNPVNVLDALYPEWRSKIG